MSHKWWRSWFFHKQFLSRRTNEKHKNMWFLRFCIYIFNWSPPAHNNYMAWCFNCNQYYINKIWYLCIYTITHTYIFVFIYIFYTNFRSCWHVCSFVARSLHGCCAHTCILTYTHRYIVKRWKYSGAALCSFTPIFVTFLGICLLSNLFVLICWIFLILSIDLSICFSFNESNGKLNSYFVCH